MADSGQRLTWPYVVFVLLAVFTMAALRAARMASNVHLQQVQTSVFSFRQAAKDDNQPLLNETFGQMTEVLAVGFDATYTVANGVSGKALSVRSTEGPVIVRRIDALYLKDLFAAPRTQVAISVEKSAFVINLHPETNACCQVRIGLGKRARLAAGIHSDQAITPDTFSPFVSLKCVESDCSLRLTTPVTDIPDLAKDLHISNLNFDRPGTAAAGGRPESGLLGGAVELKAIDLLGQPFKVRKTALTAGSALSIGSTEAATVDLSLHNSHLEVNGSLPSSRNISTYTVSAGDRVLTPTILEVMLGEPWHKSLIATIGSIAAACVSLWGLLHSRKPLRPAVQDASPS